MGKAVANLFSQLLRECIVVWNDWFGYDENKNTTKYKTTFEMVFAKIERPTKLVHFTVHEPPKEKIESANQSESTNYTMIGMY